MWAASTYGPLIERGEPPGMSRLHLLGRMESCQRIRRGWWPPASLGCAARRRRSRRRHRPSPTRSTDKSDRPTLTQLRRMPPWRRRWCSPRSDKPSEPCTHEGIDDLKNVVYHMDRRSQGEFTSIRYERPKHFLRHHRSLRPRVWPHNSRFTACAQRDLPAQRARSAVAFSLNVRHAIGPRRMDQGSVDEKPPMRQLLMMIAPIAAAARMGP